MKKKIYSLIILAFLSLSVSSFGQNNALHFDGNDDYVISSQYINLTNMSFAIEGWFKADMQPSAGTWPHIFGISDGPSDAAFVRINGDSKKLEFVMKSSAGYKVVTSPEVIQAGKWYHAAILLIKGANDNQYLLINGEVVVSQSYATINNYSNYYFCIGGDGSRNFDGEVDDVKVWSNIARSSQDVRTSMYKQVVGNESNLVAYYNLDETSGTTADNAEGTASYDGTLINMTGNEWTTSPAFFGPKNCLNFDGDNDNVWCPSITPTVTSGTIEFWINLDVIPTDNARLISRHSSYGYDEIYLLNNNGRIATTGSFVVGDDLQSTDPLPTDVWTHVAITANSAGSKLYINGILDDEGGAADFDYNTFRFGGQWNGTSYESIDGMMDEVRLWNDVRSEAEIRENMFKTLVGDEDNLVAYYNLDNEYGAVAQSYPVEANDGQVEGGPAWVTSTAFNTWLNTNTTSWATAGNWSQGNTPVSTDNVGVYDYLGSSPALSGTPTVNNLYVGSSADLSLGSNITVNGSLFLNDDIDLNGKTVTLGSSAYLYETSTAHISGSSGLIQTTRDLSNIDEDIAGLGLEITEDGDLGSSTIKRGHTTSGISSINRYFQVTTTNAPTNAGLVFNYLTNELNGQTEGNLKLWKSANGTSGWAEQASSTVSTGDNTITITGVNSFSHWTGAIKSIPTVTTGSISNITHNSASGGGEVTFDGNEPNVVRGVCWHILPNPFIYNAHTTDGTGMGSFTSSITGLAQNTTYYVRAYATNSLGTTYGENEVFTTAITSTTWTSSGWSNGPPTSSIHAIIDYFYNTDATGNLICNDLTINHSGDLFVKTGSTITVHGDLTLDIDWYAHLTIADGSSLITLGNINDGLAIVTNIWQSKVWHLISSPISDAKSQMFETEYLQKWHENMHTWTEITSTQEDLIPAKGYGFWSPHFSPANNNYAGSLNTGDISLALTFTEYSEDPNAYEGANLLGNPYPSSIDWSGLDNTYGAIYYLKSDGTYDTWNNGSGTGSATQYIAPGQGFFIVTTANGTFNVSNSDRTHTTAKSSYKATNTIINGLILQTPNGELADELWIAFDESSTPAYDFSSDAYQFFSGNNGISHLYSISNEKKLSIDVRPETETIQLGFKNNESGVYKIGIKEMDGLAKIILEDTKTETLHNLQNSDYEFSWNIDDAETRFKLHLEATGLGDIETSISHIFAYEKTVYIRSSEKLNNAQIKIIDMMGRVVYECRLVDGQNEQITAPVKDGVYMVQLISDEGTQVEKVILR